jgi:hypothetical protein
MRTQSDADVTAVYERAWTTRVKATEQVIAATEELLARAVGAAVPGAVEVVLYEDHSHDAPHGHVLHIADADGNPIMSGTGDDWHDASWTETVDEYVWDLHHLDREGFQTEGTQRIRRIPLH